MKNFNFHNPTRILFGEGEIHSLSKLVSKNEKILLLYGGGSIKKNGIYNEVIEALAGHDLVEFSGITANPRYEDCVKAIEKVRASGRTFILAVGGGSVIDAAKFIAAGALVSFDPWDFPSGKQKINSALPIGTILTLPATGSEMNGNSVISKLSTKEKRGFYSPYLYPIFSILEPRVMLSLPKKQITNGIVDAFVHVIEQYMTNYQESIISDRLAEGVMSALVEIGPQVVSDQSSYKLRANLMWSATMALNGIVGLGNPQDWATHQIGHELTAEYGIDHAESLAIVLPSLLRAQLKSKEKKLLQLGERVFHKKSANEVIDAIEDFFHRVQMKTRLADYNIVARSAEEIIYAKFKERGYSLGEERDLTPERIKAIVHSSG